MEIGIKSVNKDNSHSWVRISQGLNKLVTDLIDKEYDDNEQETSELKTEFFALKTEVFAFASRSKTKQNQEDFPLLAHLQGLFLFLKEHGLILNQELIQSSLSSGKKNTHSSSTRRTTSRRRWRDRILEIERWSSEQIWVLSILVWWCMEEQNGRRRRQQSNISILYWPVRTRNS